MIVFIAAGLLVGGLLGTRFTVGVLIPAAVLGMAIAAVGWGLAAAAPAWSAVHVLLLAVFSQIGYMCGAALRLFVAPAMIVVRAKAPRRS